MKTLPRLSIADTLSKDNACGRGWCNCHGLSTPPNSVPTLMGPEIQAPCTNKLAGKSKWDCLLLAGPSLREDPLRAACAWGRSLFLGTPLGPFRRRSSPDDARSSPKAFLTIVTSDSYGSHCWPRFRPAVIPACSRKVLFLRDTQRTVASVTTHPRPQLAQERAKVTSVHPWLRFSCPSMLVEPLWARE
jgi:hypothetical protein